MYWRMYCKPSIAIFDIYRNMDVLQDIIYQSRKWKRRKFWYLDQFCNFFLRFCNFVKINFLQNASSVRITYSGVSYQSNYINEYVTLYRPVSIRLSISIWIIYEMVS